MKKIVDERQEKELMQIERKTFWVGYFLMVVVILIQCLIFDNPIKMVIGELSIIIVQCIYLVVSCVRKGVWSYCVKPTFKNNVIASIIGSAIVAIFMVLLIVFRKSNLSLQQKAIIFILPVVVVFFIVLILLTISSKFFKRTIARQEEEK